MIRIPVSRARTQFLEIARRVSHGRERFVLQRRGKDVAALLPMSDLRLLARLVEDEEDRKSFEAARRAIERGEKPIPFEAVVKRLGTGPTRMARGVAR